MTLALRIEEYLQAQADTDALRQAERLARDAFIQAEFPALNTHLRELLEDAVGVHSRLSVAGVAQTLTVTGRSFATLPQEVITVSATLAAPPMQVVFTPVLDFRNTDQFGTIEFAPDFDANLRRSRAGTIARYLRDNGIQMRGSTIANLLIAPFGDWIELSASHLEDALAALFLR